jgi:ketosteroid isomerase-like protein
MIRPIAAALGLALVAAFAAQDAVTPELEALAKSERAFAEAATRNGIRDAFLEFFADDAIALVPDAVPAKDGLRARPSVPFAEHELLWEPRTGDIAASGELGWLTGPSTFTNKKTNANPAYGNYLSVWRKGGDGTWKVFIDIGSSAPAPVPFAPGFARFVFGKRYSGKEDKTAASAAVLEADRALNERLSAGPSGSAYASVMAANIRLHRDGMIAVVGREAASEWLNAKSAAIKASTTAGEAARSGDLAYTYGTYQKSDGAKKGPYVRIWSRTIAGDWQIVADVMAG